MKMLILMYLVAIVAANLLVVQFGPGVSVLNAFLFIGLDLTARDGLHERWRGKLLWPKMFLLIASGSALSWFLNRDAGRIALASLAAFAVAGVVDAMTYHIMRDESRMVKINGSNVFSAAADSLVFPVLAFGFPILWPVVLGQFAAKVGGGFIWSLTLTKAFSNKTKREFIMRRNEWTP